MDFINPRSLYIRPGSQDLLPVLRESDQLLTEQRVWLESMSNQVSPGSLKSPQELERFVLEFCNNAVKYVTSQRYRNDPNPEQNPFHKAGREGYTLKMGDEIVHRPNHNNVLYMTQLKFCILQLREVLKMAPELYNRYFTSKKLLIFFLLSVYSKNLLRVDESGPPIYVKYLDGKEGMVKLHYYMSATFTYDMKNTLFKNVLNSPEEIKLVNGIILGQLYSSKPLEDYIDKMKAVDEIIFYGSIITTSHELTASRWMGRKEYISHNVKYWLGEVFGELILRLNKKYLSSLYFGILGGYCTDVKNTGSFCYITKDRKKDINPFCATCEGKQGATERHQLGLLGSAYFDFDLFYKCSTDAKFCWNQLGLSSPFTTLMIEDLYRLVKTPKTLSKIWLHIFESHNRYMKSLSGRQKYICFFYTVDVGYFNSKYFDTPTLGSPGTFHVLKVLEKDELIRLMSMGYNEAQLNHAYNLWVHKKVTPTSEAEKEVLNTFTRIRDKIADELEKVIKGAPKSEYDLTLSVYRTVRPSVYGTTETYPIKGFMSTSCVDYNEGMFMNYDDIAGSGLSPELKDQMYSLSYVDLKGGVGDNKCCIMNLELTKGVPFLFIRSASCCPVNEILVFVGNNELVGNEMDVSSLSYITETSYPEVKLHYKPVARQEDVEAFDVGKRWIKSETIVSNPNKPDDYYDIESTHDVSLENTITIYEFPDKEQTLKYKRFKVKPVEKPSGWFWN